MDDQLERWENLLKQIEIRFEGTDKLTTVTVGDLEQFESEMRIKLPAGYKEFCQVFGNGCFGNSFVCIDCPSLQHIRIQSISNSEIIEAAKSSLRLHSSHDPMIQELLGNAYVFGLGVSGIILVFDLRTYDQTDQHCDIYAIDDDNCAYKLDRDFYSFIKNFCLGTALEHFPQLFRTMTYEMEYPVNRFTAIPGVQESFY